VVGIERDGQRLLNPESVIAFKEGDIVWIVGEKQKIQALQRMELIRKVVD
jgi:CPA2 family monovalent cation:H+ antiporter-2